MNCGVKMRYLWLILAIILFSSISSHALPYDESDIDFKQFKFKQEITIPIDTSREDAKLQPIDIHIELKNPCWAKNENEHSIRICYNDGSGLNELESQIYDLNFKDNQHVKSCNIVFLIPEDANGKERYFVIYDDSEKTPPDYYDHLTIEDLHFYYEPVSGQKADIYYYIIKEDGYIVYGISYKGEIYGNGIAQSVAKAKPYSTSFNMKNMDQLANFAMAYSIDGEEEYTGTQNDKNPTKNILIDGNLMIKLKISSISPDGKVKTENVYTYYYCPSITKRINVNVNHEVLKTYEVGGSKALTGTYLNMMTFKGRSATVEELNIGEILPWVHLFAEDEIIKAFPVSTDPVSELEEFVISIRDDIDLGSKAWVCIDDPTTGKTYGYIFQSNTGFIDGEEDGLQVGSFGQQSIKLPGLEVDTLSVYVSKNFYEKGDDENIIFQEGFKLSYNVEYITFEKEGYEAVDKESELYQILIRSRPEFKQQETDEPEEDIKKFTLKTYVHLAPSFPLGNLLSIALGKNFSYINAELYNEDGRYISSGSVSRIPLSEEVDLDLEGKTIFQKLRTLIRLFDWRNISFFKKIIFPDVEAGRYVVKIYRENPIFAKNHQYIGYEVIYLDKDGTINIFCRSEGKIKLSAKDQYKEGVENVKFQLLKDAAIVEEGISDNTGSAVIKVPCYPTKPYTLRVLYNGFLIDLKKITVGFKNRIIPLSRSFSIDRYKLNLRLKDTWGFYPDYSISSTITSNIMIEPTVFNADKNDKGEYTFTDIYPAEYILNLRYKSFNLVKKVNINEDETVDIVFPAEFKLDFDVKNSYGYFLADGEVSLTRKGNNVKKIIENGKANFLVPPGEYNIKVTSKGQIANQRIQVNGDKQVKILTSADSLIHNIVIFIGIILIIFSIVIIYQKKLIIPAIKLLVIALIIIALVTPWWVVNGDNGDFNTSTKMLLIPSNIVTLTSYEQIQGGEISVVPEEITLVLNLIAIHLIFTCFMIGLTILSKNKFRKFTSFLSILSAIIIIAAIAIFIYSMSLITQVSVGSFVGSGDLEITIPGLTENKILPCSWGPGIGFYLLILSFIFLVILFLSKRIKSLKRKK